MPEPDASDSPDKQPVKIKPESRLTLLRDHVKDPDYHPPMPDTSAGEDLLEHFWQAGPVMGEHPLTWSEISQYQQAIGITLQTWQSQILRRLSVDYIAESNRARVEGAICPWPDGHTDIDKLAAAKRTQAAMRAAAKT